MKPTDPQFQAMYPFASNYFTHGGLRQHYLDEGAQDGPAVVMLHGNPTWSFFYRDVVKTLSPTHRCIVPDHMGCGFSDKPSGHYPYTLKTHIDNLERLLTSLELKKMSLVVHDWGGAIGMGLAARHPEWIEKLVILNTAAFLSPRLPLRINICRIPVFGELAVQGCNGFARCATWMTTVKRLPKAVKQAFVMPYNNWGARIATHRFVKDIPMDPSVPSFPVLKAIEASLPKFADTPMLIQWGEKDFCFDMVFYEEWKKRFPDATAESYEDAGHYLLEDRGETICQRIKGFLS